MLTTNSIKDKRKVDDRLALEPIVRDSSDKIRQFLFVYLLLIAYVLGVVFSTTDRQLLLADQGLKLPLLDLTVPLVGFYLVIPYFVLALHFNLLHNVAQHHYKLATWSRAWDGQIPRERLNLLIFDWANYGSSGGFAAWVRFSSACLFLYSGPAVIATVLWRFADYQSRIAFVAHFFALWLDVIFVAIANKEVSQIGREKIARANNSRSAVYLERAKMILLAPLRAAPNSTAALLWYGCVIVMTVKLLVCIDVYFRTWEDSFVRKYVGAYVQATDRSDKANNIFGFVPRIQIDRTERLFTPNFSELKDMADLMGRDWRQDFATRGMTLDLRGRSLRYLSIPAQRLPRIWAHNAEIQGADLSFSALPGSNLISTNLQGAALSMADLEGSILMDTNLQGAVLVNARLTGAHLDRTQMQIADLSGAVFAGAVLFNVELQGANLNGLRLDGAIIQGMQVWGAEGKIERTAVLSPFSGELMKVEATPPTARQLARWPKTIPDTELEEAAARRFALIASDPALAVEARTSMAEALYVDNEQAVGAIVSAACRQNDAFHMKETALRSLAQTMQLLRHPELERIRRELESRDCPKAARNAVAP